MEEKEKIEHFLNKSKTLSFNVKYNNTEPNNKIHNDFKDFCFKESSDNYLLGINKLLSLYKLDYKYKSLFNMIEALSLDFVELKKDFEELKNFVDNANNVDDSSDIKKIKRFGE